MRVLFTSLPAYGHLHTVTALAREARSAGHTVLMATSSSLASTLKRNGIPSAAAGLDWRGDLADTFPQLLLKSPALRSRWTREDAYPRLLTRRMLGDVLGITRDFRPDVIVSERDEYAGPMAAQVANIPCAVTSAGLHPVVPNTRVRQHLSVIRDLWGVPAYLSDVDMLGSLYLDFVPDWFATEPVPSGCRREGFQFVDTGLMDKVGALALDRLVPGRPTVYVTMGTVVNRYGNVIETIITSLGNEMNLIVAIGPNRDPTEFGDERKGVLILRWVRHSDILPHCDAVVCHAGTNTVLAALCAGLPLVTAPVLSDQPANAKRCVELGVGLRLDWNRLDARTVSNAVNRVLADLRYKSRAADLARLNKRLPGLRVAVKELEQLHEAATGWPSQRDRH